MWENSKWIERIRENLRQFGRNRETQRREKHKIPKNWKRFESIRKFNYHISTSWRIRKWFDGIHQNPEEYEIIWKRIKAKFRQILNNRRANEKNQENPRESVEFERIRGNPIESEYSVTIFPTESKRISIESRSKSFRKKKTKRIRNNPKEYKRIWPNSERIRKNAKESERMR